MASRVLLHVGTPKSGTSYLESILWNQLDRLERDGVWMPGRAKKAHDALMGEVRGGVWRRPRQHWSWAKVGAEAARRSSAVLVTKEMLAGASTEQTRVALDPLAGEEVHVVVTTRQLGASLPSAWQQQIKARRTHRFSEFLDAVRADPDHGFWRHQDPVSILRRWAPDLPADRVHVVTVPRSAPPAELWRRYASVLGVDPEQYTSGERPSNASLGAVEAELLRRVNAGLGPALPMREPYLTNVRKYLTRPILVGREGRVSFGVNVEHRAWLEERAEQMISELRDYPCEVVGDLEDLRPAHTAGEASPDEVDEAEIAEVAVEALARMLANREETSSWAAPTTPDADTAPEDEPDPEQV